MNPEVMDEMGMMGYGMGGVGVLGMMFLWTVIVGAGLWLFARALPWTGVGQHEASQMMDRTSDDSPLEILNARYAAGEIAREQYEAVRSDLER